jgi:hypothetical protein
MQAYTEELNDNPYIIHLVENSKGAVSKRKEYEQDGHEKNRNYWKISRRNYGRKRTSWLVPLPN